jgi:hypothetical protein
VRLRNQVGPTCAVASLPRASANRCISPQSSSAISNRQPLLPAVVPQVS